eukprot:TRINITY_DN4434_c1_g1_i1.p1 TRINITY_DN4434_c1_g1~~TRINITY_DN4434_c1_g1_i1.p1  ORF type:complete len:872 (-),score=149.57 TRINITY_DN4434_c1_g1_i1:86-2701(-)
MAATTGVIGGPKSFEASIQQLINDAEDQIARFTPRSRFRVDTRFTLDLRGPTAQACLENEKFLEMSQVLEQQTASLKKRESRRKGVISQTEATEEMKYDYIFAQLSKMLREVTVSKDPVQRSALIDKCHAWYRGKCNPFDPTRPQTPRKNRGERGSGVHMQTGTNNKNLPDILSVHGKGGSGGQQVKGDKGKVTRFADENRKEDLLLASPRSRIPERTVIPDAPNILQPSSSASPRGDFNTTGQPTTPMSRSSRPRTGQYSHYQKSPRIIYDEVGRPLTEESSLSTRRRNAQRLKTLQQEVDGSDRPVTAPQWGSVAAVSGPRTLPPNDLKNFQVRDLDKSHAKRLEHQLYLMDLERQAAEEAELDRLEDEIEKAARAAGHPPPPRRRRKDHLTEYPEGAAGEGDEDGVKPEADAEGKAGEVGEEKEEKAEKKPEELSASAQSSNLANSQSAGDKASATSQAAAQAAELAKRAGDSAEAANAAKGVGAAETAGAPGAPPDTSTVPAQPTVPMQPRSYAPVSVLDVMNKRWEAARYREAAALGEQSEVKDIVALWSMHRSRIEEEITRRQESYRYSYQSIGTHSRAATPHSVDSFGDTDKLDFTRPSSIPVDVDVSESEPSDSGVDSDIGSDDEGDDEDVEVNEEVLGLSARGDGSRQQPLGYNAEADFIMLSPYHQRNESRQSLSSRQSERPLSAIIHARNLRSRGSDQGFNTGHRGPMPAGSQTARDMVPRPPRAPVAARPTTAPEKGKKRGKGKGKGAAAKSTGPAVPLPAIQPERPQSALRESQIRHVGLIQEAFSKKNLNVPVSTLERGLFIPEDRSERECLMNLTNPKSGSGLLDDPFRTKKKGKGKGRRRKGKGKGKGKGKRKAR